MLTHVTAISSRKEECAMYPNVSRYLRWLVNLLLAAAVQALLVRMVQDITRRR